MQLSLVYPCFRQQQTLLRHIDRWAGFAPELRRQLDFVIVDDGTDPAIQIPDCPLNLRLFRVQDAIFWNYGAKNLGVMKANCPWVFLSELDHLLDEDTVRAMLVLDRGPGRYYMFNRTAQYKQHPATYLFRARDFWNVGGLDEDLSGYYGHDDTYLAWCFRQANLERCIPAGITIECLMKQTGDAELWRCNDVPRDTTRNTQLLDYKQRTRSPVSSSKIRFNWELVCDYRAPG